MKTLLAIMMFILAFWTLSQNSIAEDMPSLEFLEYLAEDINEGLLDRTGLSKQEKGEEQMLLADDEGVAPEVGER